MFRPAMSFPRLSPPFPRDNFESRLILIPQVMSSEEPSVLVNQFIAAATSEGPTTDFSKRLARLLTEKSLSLLRFIQVLGPSLTSDDVSLRVIAIQCFAETLAETDSVIISKQDVGVLLQFISAKLEDEKLTLHTLDALSSLVRAKNFIPHVNDNLKSLLNTLENVYDPRKHLAKVRYAGFLLLETILEKHRDAIAASAEFSEAYTKTFIHIATGEKDPRNLLLSFKLNRLINELVSFEDRAINKTHDELLSDLFDVCFCYFPISFTTPENDPYKITAADLKVELRKTIASQSQYGQDAFPSLFEKLTSTNPTVRNDVLQCLLLCTRNYSVEILEQFWLSIWDALKFEILHNDILTFKPEADYIIPPEYETLDESDDNKTLILTLLVLNTLALRLVNSDSFASITSNVLEGLESNYKSLVGKTSKPAVLMLCSMAYSSVAFFNAVVDKLFSFEVWGHFIRSDYQKIEDEEEVDVSLTVAKQRDLIDNLGYVITAQKLLAERSSLDTYRDHMLIFMGQLLQSSSNIEKSLKCKIVLQLTKIVNLEQFLSPEEVTLVLTWFSENLNSLIESGSTNLEADVLVKKITNSLAKIMSEGAEESQHAYITSVISIILPPLLERVSDPAVLKIINQICLNYQFLEVLSIRYLNKLTYDACDDELCLNLIESLLSSFKQAQQARPFLATSWYSKFFPRFLTVMAKNFSNNALILELSGRLLGLIVRFSDKLKQDQILNEMTDLFCKGKPVQGFQVEFNLSEPSEKISLYKHVIVNVDRSCNLPEETAQQLTTEIIRIIPTINNEFVRLEYLQLLALFINKFTKANDGQVKELLNGLFLEGKTKKDSFEISIWIAKGLLVRVDPNGLNFLQSLLSELTESEDLSFCKLISRSYAVLMSDLEIFVNETKSTKIISGVVNLNVRMLYKQQIFEKTAPVLIENYLQAQKDEKKEIYLSTLSIIIQNVSSKVINPHLEAVLPLVINGLYSHNSCILEASLQTLETAIAESPELIQNDLHGLIKKLVDLGTTKMVVNKKSINTEKIRLLSLECLLKILQNFDQSKISSFQFSLTQLLAPGLDDKRRSVRKKTTDVCQALYELGR